ncbi:MAG: S8 family serine peptidase [Trueperaceae bacterium]|nr:S8 family serine peptidase [Trueperaceae bacterium]
MMRKKLVLLRKSGLGLLVLGLLGACSSPLATPSYVAKAEPNLLLHIEPATNPLPAQQGYKPTGAKKSISDFILEADVPIQAFGLKLPDLTKPQGHLKLLQMTELWEQVQGRNLTVAVIDSGVNATESLEAALLPGYDFVSQQPLQKDESGHGTAVATLIAGRGPYWGMAPEARILPLKVLDEHNQGSSSSLVQALLFAADLLEDLPNPHPADIINLSLGSYSYSPLLYETLVKLDKLGIMVLAAAGNDSGDIAFPARFSEVISVSAAEVQRGNWSLAPYANFGEGLDLLAPLGGWTSTQAGTYAETGVLSYGLQEERFQGTSFATAEISGLAALALELTGSSLLAREALLKSATDLSLPGWDATTGYGLINPAALIHASQETVRNQVEMIRVQVLDAGSGQEISRYYGGLEQALVVPAGQYLIRIWQDQNQNSYWESAEPFNWYEKSVNLATSQPTSLTLKLEYLDSTAAQGILTR